MRNGKSIFISGNFNIVHPGHLRLIRFAKELGDTLTVGVISDRLAGEAIHVPQDMRLDGISSISDVDTAFLVNEPIGDVIRRIRPDFVVKGKEHEFQNNDELGAVESYGGRLIFASGEVTFSSLDLIQKNIRQHELKTANYPIEFAERHAITVNRLRSIVDDFKNLNIIVIGDLIIDEYITCEPLGMSQEDPTIVVTPIDSERFVGGAGIVSAHAAGLGANVDFLTVAGDDEGNKFAVKKLREYGVETHFMVDASRPTTTKQRFCAQEKTLLRVSHLHQRSIDSPTQEKLGDLSLKLLERADLVVFSDFNYGCLPQALVDRIVARGNDLDIVLSADSQSSSQTGDVGRFRNMDLLTPTEREARLSLRNKEDGLVVLAENLRSQANAKNVLLSMGGEGALLHFRTLDGSYKTDRIPALNHRPKDVAGAGDSLLITTSMGLACGANAWESACVGSIAASVQVSRIGNVPLTRESILREMWP